MPTSTYSCLVACIATCSVILPNFSSINLLVSSTILFFCSSGIVFIMLNKSICSSMLCCVFGNSCNILFFNSCAVSSLVMLYNIIKGLAIMEFSSSCSSCFKLLSMYISCSSSAGYFFKYFAYSLVSKLFLDIKV